MKIVTRDAFMAMPGTLFYSEYRPRIFRTPCFRFDVEGPHEFAPILPLPPVAGDLPMDGAPEPVAVELDFDAFHDGEFYDERQLYAVYEPDDIRALIERLRECLPVEVK